jgi:hypothetical protein
VKHLRASLGEIEGRGAQAAPGSRKVTDWYGYRLDLFASARPAERQHLPCTKTARFDS